MAGSEQRDLLHKGLMIHNHSTDLENWQTERPHIVTYPTRTKFYFLEPTPEMGRTKQLYKNDPDGLYEEVRDWAIANGSNEQLRIARCGYADKKFSMPSDWEEVPWVGNRGYAGSANRNRELERVWFSPGCLKPSKQDTLFDLMRFS